MGNDTKFIKVCGSGHILTGTMPVPDGEGGDTLMSYMYIRRLCIPHMFYKGVCYAYVT